MTRNEFNMLCNEMTVDPAIALESDAVRDALSAHFLDTNPNRNDKVVRDALASEF